MPTPQIVVTTWRQPSDLLWVKSAFFSPSDGSGSDDAKQRQRQRRRAACERVRAWESLGNVPHAVVATAELTNAMLFDAEAQMLRRSLSSSPSFGGGGGAGGSHDVMIGGVADRLGVYMSAWTRFVDGMTDSQQRGRAKRSMYSVARGLGMPAAFVELRHRAVHEAKPALHEFRAETAAGLEWLYRWFWVHVVAERAEDEQQRRGRQQQQTDGGDADNDGDDDGMEMVANGGGGGGGGGRTLPELESRCRELVGEYLATTIKERRVAARGDEQGQEGVASALIGLCGDDEDNIRALIACLLSDGIEHQLRKVVTPKKVKKSTSGGGGGGGSSSEVIDKIEPLMLKISEAIPAFAVILDEVLLTSLAVLSPLESDELRRELATLLLIMHQSDRWGRLQDRGFINNDVLIETCREYSTPWTKHLLDNF